MSVEHFRSHAGHDATTFARVRTTMLHSAAAGAVAGVTVLGIGGRLAMRLVALILHQPTNFGWGATLGILLIGTVLGTVASTAFGIVRLAWRERVVLGPIGSGLVLGTLLFVVQSVFLPAAIRDEVAAVRDYRVVVIALFWVLCVAYGWSVARLLAARRG